VHPLQRKDLVAKTEIVHAAWAEVTQDAEPVADPDDDNAAPASHVFSLGMSSSAN